MSEFVTNNEHFLRRYRNIRNEILNRTDKYLLSDYPIDNQQKEKVILYRQELRNFINDNQENILNGKTIEFPIQPNFLNINIKY